MHIKNNMSKDFSSYFNNPVKQRRSKERVEKILAAIEKLANDQSGAKLDVRSIAKEADITTGALYHHFPSLASLFSSLFIRRVQKTQLETADLINQLAPTVTLEELADVLIDHTFTHWSRANPTIRKVAINFFYRNAEQPELLFAFIDPLIPHLKAFVARNTTNTIRDIPEDEWPLVLRTTQAAISSAFIEQLSIAGSSTHRQFAKDSFRRLLAK